MAAKLHSIFWKSFGLLVLVSTIFLSCKIGLGESVDTKDPEAEILYPPIENLKSIKGTFVLYGSCSDDKGLKEIKVKVSGSGSTNSEFSKECTAKLDEKQESWSVTLNDYDAAKYPEHNGWEFPDGKYDIYVTAYDNAGNDSGDTYYRSFEIDNTAPFFVISKPGVTKDSGGNSKYGSIFTVEGTIADDHEIAKMELYVYDTDKNLLTTEPFTEEYVATSGGTNVTIARFIKGGDNTDYNSLYEHAALTDSDGTAYFNGTVKLTDDAREYTNPTEETNNTSGNSTTVVYLYDDVYSDLMSSKSGAGLSADDLKSILNGTKTETGSGTWTIETVEGKLAASKVDTAVVEDNFDKTLAFSLNPDAEPTYTVGGYSLNTEKLTANKNAFGGQTINLIASAGRDKTKVVPSSIKVWLREITAASVANIAADTEKLVAAVKAGEETDATIWSKIFDNSESKESSDETVTIQFELPDSIVAKKYYMLVATGYDADGELFSQNDLFGFIGNANIPAPTVQIASPRNNDYCQAGFSISGTISGTDITGMTGCFVDPTDGTVIEVKDQNGNVITLNPEMNIEGETFTDSVAGLGNGKYKIKYEIADNYGQYGQATVAFSVDSKAPVMSITTVGKETFAAGLAANYDFYLIPTETNSIKGAVEDEVSGIDGVYYYLGAIPDGKTTPSLTNGWKGASLTASGWTINLDFEDLEKSFKNGENSLIDTKDGSKGYLLSISSVDNAGNASATQQLVTLYPDNLKPETTLSASAEVKEFSSKLYAKGSFTVSGTITEKAFEGITYSVNGADPVSIAVTTADDGTMSWSQEFTPDKDGSYACTFKLTDKAGNTQSYTETVIKDATAPEITITSPLSGASVSTSMIAISATDSGSGIADNAVTYSLKKGTTEMGISNYPLKKSNGIWNTDTIDFSKDGEGTYELTVNAYDNLENNSTSKKISFYYDKTPPVISSDYTNNEAYPNANSGSFVLKGTTTDSNALATVEIREGSDVLVKFVSEADGWKQILNDVKTAVEFANAADKTNFNSFNYSYTFTSQTDGTHNYIVSSTDIANKTTEEQYKVVVDTKAPTIGTVTGTTVAGLDLNQTYTFTAPVSDEKKDGAASGLSGVFYLISGTPPASPTAAELDNESSSTSWKEMSSSSKGYKASDIDFSKYATGDTTLYVYYAAIDNNLNITYSEDKKTQVNVDKTAPSVKILSYSYTDSVTNADVTGENVGSALKLPKTSSGKVTLKVQVVDTNPASLSAKVNNSTVTASAVSGETGVYTVQVQTAKTDGTDTVIEFTGTDENQRESDKVTLKVACDATAPTASIETIGTNNFIKSNSVTVKGTASDNNLDSVKVALYKTSDTDNAVKEETVETDSSNNWSIKFYDLDDVEYKVVLTAADSYSNVTTQESNLFKVDTLDPSSTLTATQDSSNGEKFYNSSFTAADKTALTSGATYYTDSAFTLGGTITEANLTSATLAITKNGTAISGSPFDVKPTSGNDWSYAQAKADGTYVYTLTLSDSASRSTVYTETVVVDTTAPTIAITSPSGDVTASSLALGGTLVENGSGVKSVIYSIVKLGTTETKIATDAAADVNGAKWSATNSLGTAEGKFKITATITDNLGLTSSATPITFWFDSSNPILKLNDFTSSYMNTVPSISGKTADANGITSIEITDDKTSTTWSATVGSDGTFSTELTGITEAAHTFTVKVTDGAGKTTEASKSVTYDKTAPTVNSSEITSRAAYQVKNEDGSVKENWFKSTNIAISVTATDSNSGLSSADYVVKDSANNEIAAGSIFGSNGTYSASVVCSSQGANTITLTIKDQAGNTKDSTLSFYIDSEVPVSLEASKAYRGKTEITGWTFSTSILTNARTTLSFTLTAADASAKEDKSDSSGLATVVLKKIGSKTFTSGDSDSATTAKPVSITSTSGSASITLTKEQIAAGSTGDVIVTVTDNVGNTADFTVANLTIDTTAPSIGFSSISPVVSKSVTSNGETTTTSYLNGTITVTGRINESNNLKTAGYKVYSDGTEVKTLAHTFTSDELTGVDNNFSFTIDTTKVTDGKSLKVEITAEDEAGNSATYDSTTYNGGSAYIVSQDTDRPEIKISNISAADAILSSGSVIGTISDDDGIKEFYYSEDYDTQVAKDPAEDPTWESIPVSSGSWNITLSGGSKSLYFKVIDTAGKTFITKDTTSSLTRPKLGLGTADASDMNEALKFKVDLNAPVISKVYILTASAVTGEGATTLTTADSSTNWSESTANFGATAKYMFVKVVLTEDIAMHDSAVSDLTITAGSTKLTLSSSNLTRTGTIADGITYIAGPFDTSSSGLKLEGNQTLSVVATDKSGRDSSAKTMMFYVDGAAPVVSLTYPLTSQEITTDVEVRGTATDASSISTLKYMIPTAAQRTSYPAKGASGWTTSPTTNSFSIEYNSTSFASKTNTADDTSLIWYATQVDSTDATKCTYALTRSGEGTTTSPYTYSQAASSALSGAVYIPILFYAEDSTGNGGYTEQYVCVNPAKSLPTAEVLAPSDSKIGTSLTLSGSASDTKEVKSVKVTGIWYVNSNDDLTSTTKDADGKTNVDKASWTQLTNAQLKTANLVTIGAVADDAATITAEGTTSWKVRMDLSKLSGISFNWIKAEVYAFDENASDNGQQARQTSATKIVAIDKDVPAMSDGYPKLVKTSSSSILGTDGKWGTFSVERAYDAGMYIANTAGNTEGGWYLIGEVTDDISVNGVTVAANSGDINLDAPANTWQSTDKKTYRFAIAVPSDSDGRIQTKLSLDDGQNQIPTTVVFNVDNTAPKMYNTSGTATAALTASELRLKSGGLQIDATSNVVENSDGSYTFGDELVEDGSGLAYVVYWFEKDVTSSGVTTKKVAKKVASPMFTSGMGTEIVSAKTANKVYLNTEKLPALYLKDVTVTSGAFTVTANDNIRAGGLVKINGAYYLISSVSGTTVTLATTSISGKYDVEVIYAQVVNHQVTEGFDSSEATGVSNDDGDGMVEMVKQSGTTYKWSSSIYTDRISDGPAKIHVIAFDEAGNSNYGYVDTSIQNNRPRLAKVYLGTDLNGNDKFDYEETETVVNNGTDDSTLNGTEFGELSFYSALSSEGKVQGTVTLKSSSFVAKNKLLVLSEVVGGNVSDTNPLKYAYKIVDSEADATATTADEDDLNSFAATTVISGDTTNLLTSSLDLDGYNYVKGSSEYNTVKHSTNSATGSLKAVVLYNDTLKTYESWTSAGGKKNKYIAFTFWDATTGTTQGTDSLYALLKVPVIINVVDDVKPSAYIQPFFWNSKEDKDSSFVYDSDGNAEGHIDIDDGKGNSNPGVSGKVWINGKATDETLLKELYFTDPAGITAKIADYADGTWTAVAAASRTPVTAGKTAADISNWGTVEFISTPDPTQSGHTVEFRISIDMTKYGLGQNNTIDVSAVDNADNESDSETAQTIDPDVLSTGKLTSHYIMDFVPYIKSIYPASAGSANRSRLGKFPVQAGKDMVIEGLNFAKDAAYTVHFYKSSDTGAEGSEVTSEAITGTVATDGQITVTAPEYSRYVEVTVSNVLTKNNTNTNGGYNIESGYVSGDDDNGLATANTNGTDFWTDDRYISVWNVDTTLEGSVNPHSGVIKKIDSTNSDNGKVYSKETGSAGVDAVSGVDDTYFGALSSDDLRIYTYDSAGKSSDSISKRTTFGTDTTDIFRVPADAMDCTIVDGVPYYVVQDNWVGNVDANCWGPGLFMARAGWQWNKSDLNSDGTPASETNYKVIIEKQGDSGSARARELAAGTGYDYVLYQFKNPRIAGWHKDAKELYYDNNKSQLADSTDYIYISYYDSYARCLKYAAYRAGHRINNNKMLDYVVGQWGSDIGANSGARDLSPEMHMADGNMTTGKAVVAGFDTLNTNPTNFVEEAGEWSDIMVYVTDNTPHPVIVYYNKTKKSLEVAYGKTSFPTHDGNVIAKGDAYNSGTDHTEDGWTKSTGITPDTGIDFGRYVSAAMDAAGNIHLAAQDATNSKLYYMYLVKDTSGIYTADKTKTTLIDATSGAGRWTDIELGNASGTTPATCKPVISYINTSYLGTTSGTKVAYAVSYDDSGKPTFEAMTDPSIWQTGDQRTSVLSSVKESTDSSTKSPVAVGFNSTNYALDFLRDEQ